MRKFKQLIMLITFVITLSSISYPVMAASNEKAITKQINKYMDGVRSCNYKKISKVSVPNAKFYNWSAAPKLKNHLKTLHKYTTYSIKAINIKGKKATVILKVQYYDIYEDARAALLIALLKSKKSWSATKFVNVLAKGLVKEYKQNLMSVTSYTDLENNYLFPETIKIEMRKTNGEWLITKHNKKMNHLMDCDFSEFLDDVSEDYSILF